MVTHHTPALSTPYYADPGDGTMLHRYLDEQFVNRFNQEAANGKLTGTSAQQWRVNDRFGANAGNNVTLRLPVHRTFYMVSCEVSCNLIGNPAFDPNKIVSAGFVVRRGNVDNYQTWQVRDGTAQGWRREDAGKQASLESEPDHYRRLLNRKLIAAKIPEPLYSGEQTHPLHAQLVKINNGNGKARNHTLLSGFLPLGGAVEAALTNDETEGDDTVFANGQMGEFEWPFGSWDGVSDAVTINSSGTLAEVAGSISEHFDWRQSTGLQVNNGRPTRAFVPFLRALIERYHIDDASLIDNEALRTLLGQIFFYSNISASGTESGNASLSGRTRFSSLLSYIESNYPLLLDWAADIKTSETESGNYSLLPATTADLYITEQQAASLRELLVMRAEKAEQMVADSLPIARYGQTADDVYFVRPFVRYLDDCGHEKIVWGPPSKPFRVVSPLDPEAVRPTAIQLPELSDIKRGIARGVTFLTPKSLADTIEKISPDLDFEDKGKSNRFAACAGLSISFSIPIITICAMILLMIILSLLNIFLGWLPWAFLKLPRLCKGNS